jgi:hypothetical protein
MSATFNFFTTIRFLLPTSEYIKQIWLCFVLPWGGVQSPKPVLAAALTCRHRGWSGRHLSGHLLWYFPDRDVLYIKYLCYIFVCVCFVNKCYVNVYVFTYIVKRLFINTQWLEVRDQTPSKSVVYRLLQPIYCPFATGP